MWLVEEWQDKYSNITNSVYMLENGLKVLHSNNPCTSDIVISAIFQAGSYFDYVENVPYGTAHFLEHMIISNPNKVFASKEDIDKFEYGTRKEPELNVNGYTSQKYMVLDLSSNQAGASRLVERFLSILDYPVELFKDYIEKERNVIMAESEVANKHDKDPYIGFMTFLVNDRQEGLTHRIIGEKADISKINADYLQQVFQNRLHSGNGIIAIQSQGGLEELEDYLLSIDEVLKPSKAAASPEIVHYNNEARYGHFKDPRKEGVKLCFVRFKPRQKATNYRERVLYEISNSLVRKLAYDVLREQLGLIYGLVPSSQAFNYGYDLRTYSVVTSLENLREFLMEFYELLAKGVAEFLESADGERWLESAVSRYIFLPTIGYFYDYSIDVATDILDGYEVYLFDKARDVAQEITKEELASFISEELLQSPFQIWSTSHHELSEIGPIIEKSPFMNRAI